ncbi:MAG: hypothetical protein QM802_07290 [Agriterribacter sp.]
MKILIVCIATLLAYQSCKTKDEQSKELKSFLSKCDELNIVYYSKDTFVFKTVDTSTIKNFTELIFGGNDKELPDTSQRPQEQLIYKSKGEVLFNAYVFDHYNKKGILSDYVSYTLQNKKCKHLLTYKTGIAINEIYHHKINPVGNPWSVIDTTKFHYEDIKNNR